MVLECFGENYNIIQINEHSLKIEISLTSLHQALECIRGIAQFEGHAIKLEKVAGE